MKFSLLIMVLLITANTFSQDNNKRGSITIDGSVLDYVIEGEGRPCLVIGSSVYYPKTFSENIRKHLKIYFVDLKWFAKGYEPENLAEVNMATIVEDVDQIRNELGLERPILLGHSIHGIIGMEYVKKHQDKVSALIVIGSPALWGSESFKRKSEDLWETASDQRKAIQQENWGKINELDRLTGKEKAVADYNRAAPQYWYDPYYDANWLWDGMTVHSEVTQHLFTKVFADYDMFRDIPEIQIPVFVGLGKYDYVIPYTLWKKEYKSLPDFTYVLFEKSGHTPQLEQSKKFDKELIKWWNK